MTHFISNLLSIQEKNLNLMTLGWEAHFVESVNSQLAEVAKALDLAAEEDTKLKTAK